METPKIIKNYVEAWSNADVDSCIAPFGTDGTYCDPAVPKPTLARELKEQWAGFFSGFPDLRFETVGLDPISENIWVWRWIGRGTNTGSFAGAPPTGRKVEQPGCEFIDVRGGRIHSVVGYYDRLTMLSQLGLAPAAQA
jgi:steroid delta-isomerase-like uncharacterized protein